MWACEQANEFSSKESIWTCKTATVQVILKERLWAETAHVYSYPQRKLTNLQSISEKKTEFLVDTVEMVCVIDKSNTIRYCRWSIEKVWDGKKKKLTSFVTEILLYMYT